MNKASIILTLLFIISCSSQNDKSDQTNKEKNDLITKGLTEEISKLKTILSKNTTEKEDKQNQLDKLIIEYTKLLDKQTQRKQLWAQEQLSYLETVEKDRAKIISEMDIIRRNKEEKDQQQHALQQRLLEITKKLGTASFQEQQILEQNKKELEEIQKQEKEEQERLLKEEEEKQKILKESENKIKEEDIAREKIYQEELNTLQEEINNVIDEINNEDTKYIAELNNYKESKQIEIVNLKEVWKKKLNELTQKNNQEIKVLIQQNKSEEDLLTKDIAELTKNISFLTYSTNFETQAINKINNDIKNHTNNISAFLATVKGKAFKFDNSVYRGLYLRLNGNGKYTYHYWLLPGTFSFDEYGQAEFKTTTGETIYLLAIKPDDTYIDKAVRIWASKHKYTRIPKNLKDSDLTSVTYGVDKKNRIYLQFSYDGEVIHTSQRFAHSI